MDKKILILGSGFVSGAVVDCLKDGGHAITIASAIAEELEILKKENENVVTVVVNVLKDCETVGRLVKDSDVVVSLLPTELHLPIIKECIGHKKHLVHASYLTDKMKKLDSEAKKAGIIVFSEIGLDPGIDHLLAMQSIDEIHARGEKVKSFISYCGGLPAPEFSENPLRYKFSWSPRTALVNLLNGARYLEGNVIKEVSPGGDLIDVVSEIKFLPGFALEGHPNRDSLLYRDFYGIPLVENLLRGTLRYRGFAKSVKVLKELGLLSLSQHPDLNPTNNTINTWKELISKLIGTDVDSCDEKLKCIYGESQLEVMKNLGLLGNNRIVKYNTPLDTLSNFLAERLAFEPHERDIVILRHEITAESSVGKKILHEINLVVYGDPKNTGGGFSAMAKTVGAAVGIATEMILEGEIEERGMILPLQPSIYKPMLKRLSDKGIIPITKVKNL